MPKLHALHVSLGATMASDGIPLHYSDQRAEYHAALEQAVLLDRSHEGRILLTGRDAYALVNRMSTNRVEAAPAGRPTLFTTPAARIIERVEVVPQGEDVLLLTHPPRAQMLADLLRRNIFFNDQAEVRLLTPTTAAFAIHGPAADAIVTAWLPGAAQLPRWQAHSVALADQPVTLVRRQALAASHWMLICPREGAAPVYRAVLEGGAPQGMIPAGSLTYHVLRVRAGVPSLAELNEHYIPLELGLWDEVSFQKGCYTGQEIIARMDSREKLVRLMVRLHPAQPLQTPAPLLLNGAVAGEVTSAVVSPDGELFAIGIVRLAAAAEGTTLLADTVPVRVGEVLGTQPEWARPS